MLFLWLSPRARLAGRLVKINAHSGCGAFVLGCWLGAAVLLVRPAAGEESADMTTQATRDQAQGFTTAEQLEAGSRWRLKSLEIEGVGFIRRQEIRGQLDTKPRSWIAFWRDDPEFEPSVFLKDLMRVTRFLEADGYYAARVTHDLVVLKEPERQLGEVEPPPAPPPETAEGKVEPATQGPAAGLLSATIHIDLDTPVKVCTLDLDLGPVPVPPDDQELIRKDMPVAVGAVFTERGYQAMAERVAAYFKQHGYATVNVERSARVDVPQRCVAVSYAVSPGEPGVFGDTAVQGLEKVSEEIVRKELAYSPGEPYDLRKLEDSQSRIRNLRLFSIVRMNEQPMTPDRRVPIIASLREGPQHEIRVGVGYSTEDEVRGLFSWRDYNFLGGARQLGVSAKASLIERRINADFVQPHWPGDPGRTSLTYVLEEDDESTYLLNSSRLVPRVDWRINRELGLFVFGRVEYDTLSGVSDETKSVLADFVNSGFTASAGLGARWTHVDDALNPHRGVELNGTFESAGGPLDADFSFIRLIGDVHAYHPLVSDFSVATRVRVGFADPYDGTKEIPLWDRFYSGGTNSVRGYARRRVGPISGSDDPVGGRSLFEGSLELRHPIYGPVGGALFVDAGDVELQSWRLDPDNVQVGVGFGVSANTPVGPARLDIGFGLDRNGGDNLVQVHFSIGPTF
jgi:outer membrane protein assembly factor BamA